MNVERNLEVIDIYNPQHSKMKRRINLSRFNIDFISSNIQKILNDPTLFLSIYCESYRNSVPEENQYKYFEVVKNDTNTITIQGKSNIVKSVCDAVENLRIFFVKGFESRQNFQVCAIYTLTYTYFKEPAEMFDVSNPETKKYSNYQYLKPALNLLSSFLGLIYNKTTKLMPVKKQDSLEFKNLRCDILTFCWYDKQHSFKYLIKT